MGRGRDLPLVPEHFVYVFFLIIILFLVDIISNLLKLYRQVINIDFLHTLSHLSKPLRFWQRYIVVLRKSHALFSISYREQQEY